MNTCVFSSRVLRNYEIKTLRVLVIKFSSPSQTPSLEGTYEHSKSYLHFEAILDTRLQNSILRTKHRILSQLEQKNCDQTTIKIGY
jgi:hypothetical protein